MLETFIYALISVIIVSLISLVGIITYFIKDEFMKKWIYAIVSFSVGALLGGTFVHIIPHLIEEGKLTMSVSLTMMVSILVFFILEKYLHWHHCSTYEEHKCEEDGPKTYGYMNLFGDAIHNTIDGIAIGASYLSSIELGIATTLVVILHEIPQEIGDFGVLLHAGFSKYKALWYNFLSALTAVAGTILIFVYGMTIKQYIPYIMSITAGSFIYIAVSDLMPELHKEKDIKRTIIQIISILLGISVMFLVLFLKH